MARDSATEMPETAEPEAPWRPARELAPSEVREDAPRLARGLGWFGLCLLALGIAGVYASASLNRPLLVGPGTAIAMVACGLALMLYHAAVEKDLQIRRTYGVLGFSWLVFAVVVTAVPFAGRPLATRFLSLGFMGLALHLFFLMPFVRNEDDPTWRNAATYVVGGVGLVLALTAFIGGNVSEGFLLPYGLMLGVLGLFYLWAFVGMQGAATDLGYRAGLLMGVMGGVAFLAALARSVLPGVLYSWHWIRVRPEPYFVPSGLLVMAMGALYLGLSLGLCWDSRFVVLTRRELAAFFYSPIAYIVLFGLTAIAAIVFWQFIEQFIPPPGVPDVPLAVEEPIIVNYIVNWLPVITVIFVVPVLTMRLLAEEQRTGTLEVLLTAPVGETLVVLSKFLAALIFFLIAWLPLALFLVALRVEGGKPFEYRPLLTFFFALAATGAGFVAMGEFFSSLTRNQIASAILTFAGMLGLLAIFFVKGRMEATTPESRWVPILGQASYVDLWLTSMRGVLAPRYMIFHVSAAVFWLFLTTKVLESRRWR